LALGDNEADRWHERPSAMGTARGIRSRDQESANPAASWKGNYALVRGRRYLRARNHPDAINLAKRDSIYTRYRDRFNDGAGRAASFVRYGCERDRNRGMRD